MNRKAVTMSVAKKSNPQPDDTEFVEFWNEILAPKFFQFKHVLVGGLT
jgi:hypothetical protein